MNTSRTLASSWKYAAWGASTALVAAACNAEPPPSSGSSGAAPPLIDIAAQSMESGFHRSPIRRTYDLPAYAITRHPITRAEYRTCVEAGNCALPPDRTCADLTRADPLAGPNYEREGVTEAMPVTCVGVREARAYCDWVGGSLPTFEEWLLAARGPSARRFPWGNDRPSCEQHPRTFQEPQIPCQEASLAIGAHSAGASPAGAEDVLLAPGELLETAPAGRTLLPACARGSAGHEEEACVIYGLDPGAIDSVRRLFTFNDQIETSPVPYGFRCVWREKGSK
jgi:formylglycine-generating enzyme required for sulfatase activity